MPVRNFPESRANRRQRALDRLLANPPVEGADKTVVARYKAEVATLGVRISTRSDKAKPTE